MGRAERESRAHIEFSPLELWGVTVWISDCGCESAEMRKQINLPNEPKQAWMSTASTFILF